MIGALCLGKHGPPGGSARNVEAMENRLGTRVANRIIPGSGISERIDSAASIAKVDSTPVVSPLATQSDTAATTSGAACPSTTAPLPIMKSRYSLPCSSTTRLPDAREATTGLPWRRRLFEWAPPGI